MQGHCRKSSNVPPAGTLQKIVEHSACRDPAENRRALRLQGPCRKSSSIPLAGTLQKIVGHFACRVVHSSCRDTAENRRALRLQGHCRKSSGLYIPPAGTLQKIVGLVHSACRDSAENHRAFRMQGDCRKSFSIPRGNRIIIHSSINISITTIDRSTGLIVHSIRRGARPVIAEGNVDLVHGPVSVRCCRTVNPFWCIVTRVCLTCVYGSLSLIEGSSW